MAFTNSVAGMGDEEKGGGYGPWSRVPQWDGSPATWRKFKRGVTWWISSVDLSGTTKFNLAARFLLRQEGIARQRGEEFNPSDLQYKPAEMGLDPDTGESIQLTEPDYLAGLNKLMAAWETMNGRTALDKRGELRQTFYMDLQRRPGERVTEFATRFRSLVADLRAEGVNLHDNELGWWLKQKLGLDALRKQLLDTALQGSEDYNVIETEVLRLFRDLHDNDPLKRRFEPSQKLTVRRMFGGRPGSSAASSVGPSSSYRSSLPSISSNRSNQSGFRQSIQAKQANVTELDEVETSEAPPEEEGDDMQSQPNLDEVLQAEAEILACELEEAENEGVDEDIIQNLETNIEAAAETLVTMREARQQLASVRKDRGYGKASTASGGKGNRKGQVAARKSSGKHPCFDCGQIGHWAGDEACPTPGAGSARPKGAAKKPAKQVRVAEAVPSTVHSADVTEVASLPLHDVLMVEAPTLDHGHEVMMISGGSESLNLEQALAQNVSRSAMVAGNQPMLPQDKQLVGALDSACNRTCAGQIWVNSYLDALRQHAPPFVQSLILCEEESENFRFGNNGVVPSIQRWRLPAMVGETLVLIWVSLVPVGTLGCLIGRDFLEAIGAMIDFTKRTLVCSTIASKMLNLRQMAAGHFVLEMLPPRQQWGRPPQNRWRRIGQDGIVELQMSRKDWARHCFSEKSKHVSVENGHEHQLTEKWISETMNVSNLSASPSMSWLRPTQDCAGDFRDVDLRADGRGCSNRHFSVPTSMAKVASPPRRSFQVVNKRAHAVVVAATILAISAIPLSFGFLLQGLDGPDSVDGRAKHLASASLAVGSSQVDGFASWGVCAPSKPRGIQDGLHRGRAVFLDAWNGEEFQRSRCNGQKGCNGRNPRKGQKGFGEGQSRRNGPAIGGTKGRFAVSQGGLGSTCNIAACQGGSKGHGGAAEEEDQRTTQCHEGWFPSSLIIDVGSDTSQVRCFEVFSCEKECYAVASGDGRVATSTGQGTTRSVGRRFGWTSTSHGSRTDDSRGDGSAESRVIDGAGSNEVRSTARTRSRLSQPERDGAGRVASVSDDVVDGPHVAGSSPGSTSGEAPCQSDRWCAKPGEDISGEPAIDGKVASDDFVLRSGAKPMKAGIAQMISQAWNRHCRDREAVSKNRFEVMAVLMEQWNGEIKNSMNEIFVTEVHGLNLFVTEVYTDTEPIAKEAVRRGLRAGESLTLASGWDFRDEKARRRAIKKLDETDPYLVILAFPCNVWSNLMNLNPMTDIEGLREAARVLVLFAIEVAEHRMKKGRHFLMENPVGSAAWRLPEMVAFLAHPLVRSVVIDQCMFGLMDAYGKLHKKGTRLVTSMQALVSMMVGRRCDQSHEHALVIGGGKITRPSGHYPAKLCQDIVSGALQQFDFETQVMMHQATAVDAVSNEVLAAETGPEDDDGGASASDDDLGDIDVPANKIPSNIKAAVRRLHVNTGHRSRKRLARALVLCGAPAEAVMAAKTLKCDVCDEKRSPKTRRPATLPSVKDVGAQAHIDLLQVEDAFKQSFYVVHATDKVSRYQLAALIPNKSSAEVTKFLSTMWLPILGSPQILVADQGREFISREFEEWCGTHSIYLHHIGVQCPWQNGIAERSGATLKAVIGALVRTYSLGGVDDMQRAVAEAAAAYNCDVNEEGVSPLQAVTGRQAPSHGDVLGGLTNRLAEHSLIEDKPSLARQVALRETARVAMVRLHYSRGFRRAELARARTTALQDFPQPGDICYFWRESKYNPRKRGRANEPRRRLQLKRWFGPALMVAVESGPDGEEGANCFLSFRGQLTKCGKEHVRKASSLEQVSHDAWEEAIRDVIAAADRDKTIDREVVPLTPAPDALSDSELDDLFEQPAPQAAAAPAVTLAPVEDAVANMVPLTPKELAAAIQPGDATPISSRMQSRRQSLEPAASRRLSTATAPEVITSDDAMPSVEPSQQLLQGAIQRARSLERNEDGRGEKRAASRELARGDISDGALPPDASGASPAFEALMMSWDQICNLAGPSEAKHPLLQVQAMAEADRRMPADCVEGDHGSWDGRWSFLCERDWKLMQELGQQWPNGSSMDHEAYDVQAGRKECHWKSMSKEDQKGFSEAAVKGWLVYVENGAVEVLDLKQSQQIHQRLKQTGETSKVMQPRFVMTDKNASLRTENRWLPKKYSSRRVVPGYKDKLNLEGRLRRDAPTGSRLAQHMLFIIGSWNREWALLSGDIKSAFMKGDLFADETRELYLCPTDSTSGPAIPLQRGQLARVRKAVFGLADAPREWWLRLSRSLAEHHWMRTLIDGATWLLWDSGLKVEERTASNLKGIIVAHVDDLLFVGDADAVKSFDSIGDELGFGSREADDFTWCGKRIRRAEDRTIRLSMLEYHTNLKEIFLTKQRKADPTAELTGFETRQLRALLGSFQWLVAQLRFDMAFGVSSLQGEKPTIATILRANQLLKQFQQDCNFELIFRPIDPAKCGIMVVSDAALGNVTLEGSTDAAVTSKVYSQACYFVLVADPSLMSGQSGFFNILDSRSHRISRVCRSTYAAETLSAEEAFDIGQLCRGFVATVRGYNMVGKCSEKGMDMVDLTIVVDAKDVFDKTNSDTTTYGAQKSMAFTVAWMRSQLRRPRTALKWTSTENMWVDGGTKQMDLSHMRRIMKCGQWSVSYCPAFVKQVYKASKGSKLTTTTVTLPGEPLIGSDPLLNHLLRLGEQRGWHFQSNVGVHVAFGAKSFRTPEPRFSMEEYPIRSSFARFSLPSGQMEWRQLERGVRYGRLSNQHALFGGTAGILVTLFHADDGVSLD